MGITTHFQIPSLRQELLKTLFLFIPDTDVVLNVYEKLQKINVEKAREWHVKRWGGWEIIVPSMYSYPYYSASYGSQPGKPQKNICVCRDMYQDDGSCIKRKIKGWGWTMPTIPPGLLRDIELLGNYFHKERCNVFIPGTRFRKQWGMNAISISSRVKDINHMNHLVKMGIYNVEMDDYQYVDIDSAYIDLFIIWARKYFQTGRSTVYKEFKNQTMLPEDVKNAVATWTPAAPCISGICIVDYESISHVSEYEEKKSQYLKMFTKSWGWWSDKSNKNIHRELIGTW